MKTPLNRLELWAKETKISHKVPCKISYVANVTAELGELYEATKKNDTNEIVDAIADVLVFTLTEIFKAYKNYPVISAVYDDDEYYKQFVQNLKDFGFKTDTNTFIYIIQKDIFDESAQKNYQYLFNVVNVCYNKLVSMGYNIRLVMNEVTQVLESRTGEWSDEDGKWIKDTSPEAKALWYEPDYSKCLEVLSE